MNKELPLRLQRDEWEGEMSLQYPSIRSAILSASVREGHVIVKHSDAPEIRNCKTAFL